MEDKPGATYTKKEVSDWLKAGNHRPGPWKAFRKEPGWRILACKDCGVSVIMFRNELKRHTPLKCSVRRKVETTLTPDELAAQFIRAVPLHDPDDPCPHMEHVCHPYQNTHVC